MSLRNERSRIYVGGVWEMGDAFDYYESRQIGLGSRFIDAVMLECQKIVQYPKFGREIERGNRRVNVPAFPYYIGYFIIDERIIIAAIAHASRSPDYWKRRIF